MRGSKMIIVCKRNYARIVLLTVLICIIVYSFTGEINPVNEGTGWDGSFYCGIIMNFENLILSHGIDQYHMTRFLPFAIIHYLLRIFGVPITVQTAIVGVKFFNAFLIMLLIWYFFKLSRLLSWDTKTEIIAFSLVFFNFPILKYYGYSPITTDCAALVLSYIAIYYYLSHNFYGEILVGLLALMTWPVLAVISLALLLFPRDSVKPIIKTDLFSVRISLFIRMFFLFLPFFALIMNLYLNRLDISKIFISLRGETEPVVFVMSFLAVLFFYYSSTKIFESNWQKIFELLLCRKTLFKIVFGLFGFCFLYRSLTSFGGKSGYNFFLGEFLMMHWFSLTDVFIFLETPFMYLGIFPVLTIMCWKEIVSHVKDYGVGYFFVIALFLIMIMDIETRKLSAFIPFLLIPLIKCILSRNLKKWVVVTFPMLCLLTSLFWFEINTPDILYAFDQSPYSYVYFPAQRYFMFFGPWQSHSVYLVTIIIEILLGSLIYVLYKRGMLTNRNV